MRALVVLAQWMSIQPNYDLDELVAMGHVCSATHKWLKPRYHQRLAQRAECAYSLRFCQQMQGHLIDCDMDTKEYLEYRRMVDGFRQWKYDNRIACLGTHGVFDGEPIDPMTFHHWINQILWSQGWWYEERNKVFYLLKVIAC